MPITERGVFAIQEDITSKLRDVDSNAHAHKKVDTTQKDDDAIAQRWAFMDYDKDGEPLLADLCRTCVFCLQFQSRYEAVSISCMISADLHAQKDPSSGSLFSRSVNCIIKLLSIA